MRILVLLGLVLLSGCTQEVAVESAPVLDIPSAYADKIPGTWLVAIDDSKLSTDVVLPAEACSQMDYPLDVARAFDKSVMDTFRGLAEEVRPADPNAVLGKDYTGVVRVRVDNFRVTIREKPNFMQYAFQATVEIDAKLAVDGPNGRITDAESAGTADSEGASGMLCESAGPILAAAARNAIADALAPLAEKFANSASVRATANMPR